MERIVPTILTATRRDLEEKLARVQGKVRTVQIDVVDGRFATPATWPYTEPSELSFVAQEGALRTLGDFVYEIDLMIENAEQEVGKWIAAGATRIIVHIEHVRSLQQLLTELETKYGHQKDFAPGLLSIGVALNIDTDTRVLDSYLSSIDFVQFMGIRAVGHQGEPYDAGVVRKLRTFSRTHIGTSTQVDGGVSRTSAPDLISAGADRLVVGSALWHAEDIGAEIHALEGLFEAHGRYA